MQDHQRSVGFWSLWNGAEVLEELSNSQYPRDMTHHETIAKRTKVVASWQEFGLNATASAFSVSRATLYRWAADATPKSRAHRNGYQKRVVPPEVAEEINRIREIHPRLGKEKLTPLLKQFCEGAGLPVYSEATVGRILKQLKTEGRLRAPVLLRMNGRTGKLSERIPALQIRKKRRGSYRPTAPGGLLQINGVLKFVDGRRRYVFTAVDLTTRIAFSKAFPTASSRNGKEFLQHVLESAPFPVTHIQTDNGSEFLKEFHKAALEAELTHFFNYVKQPKYQGWIERFNRTIQEEFIDGHLSLLAHDLPGFNEQLALWILWYNTERIHRGLNQKTSQGVQKYTPLQYLGATVLSQRG